MLFSYSRASVTEATKFLPSKGLEDRCAWGLTPRRTERWISGATRKDKISTVSTSERWIYTTEINEYVDHNYTAKVSMCISLTQTGETGLGVFF
jgi:hypothetical protein